MKIPYLRKKSEIKSCHNVTWEDHYSWIHQKNILEVLKDKFTVQINSGYTLLTVFNYNDAFNQLDKIIDGRDIALEQKSTSALQLLLIN